MMYEYELVYNSERFYTIFALLFAIILTSIIATYALFRVRSKEQRIGALFLNVIVLIYQTSQFLVVVSPPKELNLFVSIQCIAFCLLGPAFYLYNRTLLKMKPIGSMKTIILYSLSCIEILLVSTNSFHGLFYSIYNVFYVNYETIYFLALIFNSLCAMAGYILLMKYSIIPEENNILQRILYPICLITVIGAGIFDGISPELFPYDITPSSISIIQILFLFSNRLSGLSGNLSISRSNILDCIKESVIMTDMEGNIIFYNDTPLNRQISMENGADIRTVLNQMSNINKISDGWDTLYEYVNLYTAKNIAHNHASDSTPINSPCGEITMDAEKSWYSYTIQPIKKGKLHVAGVLYVFRDITKDKELINHLNRRNSELAATYDKMKKYSARIRQLSVEKERNKILKKINRDIEGSVIKIISLLKDIETIDDIDAQEIKMRLHKSIEIARNGITGIRRSIHAISDPRMREGEEMND